MSYWQTDKELLSMVLSNPDTPDIARELAERLERLYELLEPALVRTDSVDVEDLVNFVIDEVELGPQ